MTCLLPQHADALMLTFSLLHDDGNAAVLQRLCYIKNFIVLFLPCDTNVTSPLVNIHFLASPIHLMENLTRASSPSCSSAGGGSQVVP